MALVAAVAEMAVTAAVCEMALVAAVTGMALVAAVDDMDLVVAMTEMALVAAVAIFFTLIQICHLAPVRQLALCSPNCFYNCIVEKIAIFA